MNRSALVLHLLLASALAGCPGEDPRLGAALLVTVQVAPGAKSQCVRVFATPETGAEAVTKPIARKDELHVAVYRGEGWSGPVSLHARGYASCDPGGALTGELERTETVVKDFPAAQSETVTLELAPKVVVVDLDGDGKSGSDDCDDDDPNVFVGQTEPCASTVDLNCNGLTGCADLQCSGACENGQGRCESSICVATTEISCVDGADNDKDLLVDCADPDCLGRSCADGNACTTADVCKSDGSCGGSPIPNTCNNAPGVCFLATGSCNPEDGGCVYRARDAGTTCSDLDACTSGDRCLLDGGCGGGTLKQCTTPPASVCFEAVGVCNPLDAGCNYAVRENQTCNDGQACTVSDLCRADGGCRGASKICYQTSDPCHADAGTCSGGNCTYPALTGPSCDDGNACTTVDTCNAGSCVGASPMACPGDVCLTSGYCDAGSCSYTRLDCPPQNECQTGGSCVAPSGCQYQNKTNGTSCLSGGGSCQSGACVPNYPRFTYVPSNFNPDAGYASPGTASATVELSCGTVTFDTGAVGGAAPLFTGCAGKGTATAVVIKQENGGADAGLEAVLLPLRNLTISSSGTLRVTGSRALIIAVHGDALIDGTIDVSAQGSTAGPGASLGCPNPATNGIMPTDLSLPSAGGSGAGGGAHGAAGGNGGNGDGNNVKGQGGSAAFPDTLRPLRGGCAGALGGSTASPGQRPQGGGGGGAIQLSVTGLLKLPNGKIYASGGGGEGGAGGSLLNSWGEGAGGGGAGGAILLEGGNITLDANSKLTANGGAGGEGGTGGASTVAGANGPDGVKGVKGPTPNSGDNGNGAAGGQGGGEPEGGGNASDASGGSKAGGGGGGGGSGRIKLYSPGEVCRISGHVVSPSGGNTSSANASAQFVIDGTATSSGCP